MIGRLPETLNVNNREYAIRSDFRVALLIFEAFEDAELTEAEKAETCLKCLYKESVKQNDMEKAYEQAVWFLDGGDMPKTKKAPKRLMDWSQDESMIFAAVNKVAGYETRTCDYLHWWSFLGLFGEIGEGLFSTVMSLRSKKAKGRKLEKYELDFLRENRELVELKRKYTSEEQAEIDRINKLLE